MRSSFVLEASIVGRYRIAETTRDSSFESVASFANVAYYRHRLAVTSLVPVTSWKEATNALQARIDSIVTHADLSATCLRWLDC